MVIVLSVLEFVELLYYRCQILAVFCYKLIGSLLVELFGTLCLRNTFVKELLDSNLTNSIIDNTEIYDYCYCIYTLEFFVIFLVGR